MDNRRVLLGAALATVLFLIYTAYLDFENRNNAALNPAGASSQSLFQAANQTVNQTEATTENVVVPESPALDSRVPTESANNSDVPVLNSNLPTASGNQLGLNANPTNQDLIQVETEQYRIVISLSGGNIVELGLREYPVSVEKPNEPFLLMKKQLLDDFVANSGLLSNDIRVPNHTDTFQTSQSRYEMGNQLQLVVPLVWESDDVKVVKNYIFNRGSHLIQISYDIQNKTDKTIQVVDYGQFNRSYVSQSSNFLIMPSYVGGAAYLNEKYQKMNFDDIKSAPMNETSRKGWVAMTQHYFFSAWIPPKDLESIFYSKALNDGSVNLGYKGASLIPVAPNSQAQNLMQVNLYAGAKENRSLLPLLPSSDQDTDFIAERLYLTADYGWLAFLARPLFSYMQWIFSWVNSWPLTIVLLVLTIKLVFYKLSEKSYRSMAKMRKLTPRLTAIKERCGDDKLSFQKEMMALYKNEKVNPMSGCFPILIQIPVFIALYWVLLESVEMRQVPFLWIKDLSLPDPFYLLPILMAVTMFIQFKLNPKPTDETQAKVMMFMPIVFSILFIFFPAALVFYWVINNILSII